MHWLIAAYRCRLVHLVDDYPQAAFCGQWVEAAVSITEALAAGHQVDVHELAAAEDGAMRAVIVTSEILPPCEPAAYAANAAYAAISAARALREAVASGNFTDEAERVAGTGRSARGTA